MRNLISFDQLCYAARCCHSACPFLILVDEWAVKREHVELYLHDLPSLLKDYTKRAIRDHPADPSAKFVDAFTGLRLAAACEGLAHCIYAMADIAASVGHKASTGGAIPNSSHKFCKKVAAGELDSAFIDQLPDLSWYARIRELRTEWSHNSSIFIGGEDMDPVLCVNRYRSKEARVFFKDMIQIRPRELIDWSERATITIDRFGSAIFFYYILPKMPLDEVIYIPSRDDFGFFKKDTEARFVGQRMSVREYLRLGGIDL